jgi:hypothetical protein
MITNDDPEGQPLLFPIEDVSNHDVKSLDSSKKVLNDTGSRLLRKSASHEPQLSRQDMHTRELVESLTSFRSSMSHLGCVFGEYAMDPKFWFATMCFENWLAINSCILKGSWVCPSEVRDGLRDFLLKSQNPRTLDLLTRNHNGRILDGESARQIFQRAEVERQRFEIAYKALRKLEDTSTIDTSGTEISCQSVYHLPHSAISEHNSCSEPIHLLEDLESIGTLLHHMVEAGKNEPTIMLSSKDQFDASSARTCKLERDLVQAKAFRAMTNIQYLCDGVQDKLLDTRIDELEQSWKEEKCFRGEVVACLLRHTKTDLEGCEKVFEVTRNHRSRNGAFLDLRKFGRCCGPDASLVSVTSA